MMADRGLFALVVVVAWFGAGFFLVATAFRHRRYVKTLPPTPGNLKIKRQNQLWLIVGALMIAIGAWNTYVTLGL